MADHSKPTLTSTYSNFVTEIDARLDDLSRLLASDTTTPTNLVNGAIRWNATSKTFEKYTLATTSWAAIGVNDASNLTTGTVATARLGSGTADATTWLRGDGTWQLLPVATGSVSGVVSTADQSFAGRKTFLNNLNISNATEAQFVVEKTGTNANYSYFYNNGTTIGMWDNTNSKNLFKIDPTQSSVPFQFNSGYGDVATAYGCRAWVNFDGTGTSPLPIRGSGNVTSVTDISTGSYQVNFTNAMPDVNYCVSLAGTDGASGQDFPKILTTTSHTGTPITMSTTAVRVGGSTSTDWKVFCVAIFR